MATTKFTLAVPHHTYDADSDKYDFDNHLYSYMKLYSPNITESEKKDLLSWTKYVRIMGFQDSPSSKAYIKAYCRDMSDMKIPSHKAEANEMKKRKTNNQILVEINYSTMGFFFLYNFP